MRVVCAATYVVELQAIWKVQCGAADGSQPATAAGAQPAKFCGAPGPHIMTGGGGGGGRASSIHTSLTTRRDFHSRLFCFFSAVHNQRAVNSTRFDPRVKKALSAERAENVFVVRVHGRRP